MKKILRNFTVLDLVLIASMATLGIAIKPIINPIIKILNATLLVPGGAIAGGIYMLWLTLGAMYIKKPYVGFVIGLVQAIMVMLLGISSHGILSLITYSMPGLMIDFVLYLTKYKAQDRERIFFATMLANLTGTMLTSIIIFKLPFFALILSASVALFSGGIGGMIAYHLHIKLQKLEILI